MIQNSITQPCRFRTILFCLLIVFSAAAVLPQIAAAYPAIPPTGITYLNDMPLGSYVKGRDGAFGFSYSGQSCFFFGDTALTQNNADGKSWISDSMYHTTDTNGNDGIGGGDNYQTAGQAARQWIPYVSGESSDIALWAESAFYDSTNAKQYVVYSKISYANGGIGIGFVQVTSLTSAPSRIQHRTGQTEPYCMFLNAEFATSDAVALVANGYLYFYFIRGGDWGNVRIGRAALSGEAFKTRANWTFYNGSSWVSDAASATNIMGGAGVGSIAWNTYLNCYLFTYTAWVSSDVMMAVADNPQGPWSAAKRIYTGNPPTNGGSFNYMGQAYSFLATESGRAQITGYSMGMNSDNTERVPMMRTYFNPVTAPVLGTWYRFNVRHTGMSLDSGGGSTDGTDSKQYYSQSTNTNQQWCFEDAGSGYYKIKNRYSGKYLEQDGGQIGNDGQVQIYTWNGGTNQQWSLVYQNDGFFKLKNRWSGRIAYVYMNSYAVNTLVKVQDDLGLNDNQEWCILTP